MVHLDRIQENKRNRVLHVNSCAIQNVVVIGGLLLSEYRAETKEYDMCLN